MNKLYHCTSEKKAKLYNNTGYIKKPVRGFDTLLGACYWAIKVGRKVIYEIDCEEANKLPDHHNKFGDAYFIDGNVSIEKIKCVVSPK